VESEISFEETMGALTAELAAQMKEAAALDVEIKTHWRRWGLSYEWLEGNRHRFYPSRLAVPTFSSVLSQPLRNGIYKPKEYHGRGTRVVNMG
jgi:hypothetical protein